MERVVLSWVAIAASWGGKVSSQTEEREVGGEANLKSYGSK